MGFNLFLVKKMLGILIYRIFFLFGGLKGRVIPGVHIEENPNAQIFDIEVEWKVAWEFLRQQGVTLQDEDGVGEVKKISRKDLKAFLYNNPEIGDKYRVDSSMLNHSFLYFRRGGEKELAVKARGKSYLNSYGEPLKEGKLGSGRHSEVYPVRTQGGDTVAIKELELISESPLREFTEEVIRLNKAGRNAQFLFDYGKHRSLIAQEFISGVTLNKYLKENEMLLNPKIILALALEFLEQVQDLRRRGIFHPDLNCFNSIVDVNDSYSRGVKVSIIDFGLLTYPSCDILRLIKIIKSNLKVYGLAPIINGGHHYGLLHDLQLQRADALEEIKTAEVKGMTIEAQLDYWQTDDGDRRLVYIEVILNRVYLARLTEVLEKMYLRATEYSKAIAYTPDDIQELSAYSCNSENTIVIEVQCILREECEQSANHTPRLM